MIFIKGDAGCRERRRRHQRCVGGTPGLVGLGRKTSISDIAFSIWALHKAGGIKRV